MKVFPSLFSKSDRQSNARSVGRRAHAAKSPFRRVLFGQARESLATPGGAKRSQFSFAPLVSKKKADYRFRYVMLVYLSTQSNSYSLIRFFFWQKKRKRKSLAKRQARKRDFAACARRPTLRALDRRSLLGKRRKTFSNRQRRGVPDKLQIPALRI